MDWHVIQGSRSAIERIREHIGQRALVPMMTVHRRVSGRSRRMESVVVPQYPGYGFLATDVTDAELDYCSLRWGLQMLTEQRDGRSSPVLVPDAQLEYARLVEVRSIARPSSQDSRTSGQIIQISDRVVIEHSSLRDRLGTVAGVSRGMVLVYLDGFQFPVRVSFEDCRVVSTL